MSGLQCQPAQEFCRPMPNPTGNPHQKNHSEYHRACARPLPAAGITSGLRHEWPGLERGTSEAPVWRPQRLANWSRQREPIESSGRDGAGGLTDETGGWSCRLLPCGDDEAEPRGRAFQGRSPGTSATCIASSPAASLTKCGRFSRPAADLPPVRPLRHFVCRKIRAEKCHRRIRVQIFLPSSFCLSWPPALRSRGSNLRTGQVRVRDALPNGPGAAGREQTGNATGGNDRTDRLALPRVESVLCRKVGAEKLFERAFLAFVLLR